MEIREGAKKIAIGLVAFPFFVLLLVPIILFMLGDIVLYEIQSRR